MKISESKPSTQDNASSKQLSLDNRESELRKQIADLREEKKNISNDKDKTSEEKKKEKQAVQEEIQTLNRELRQYQIQKRQEEAAKKQEALKEAARERETRDEDADEEQTPETTVFGNEESGVLISLSATKKQILGMQRIRTDLERKQRTAATDEEKADLQNRINNVTRNIGKKITITEDSAANSHNPKKKSANARQVSDQPFDWKKQSEIATAVDDPEEQYDGNLLENKKKFFSTVSIFIK